MDLKSIERACECVVGGVGSAQERAAAQQQLISLGTDVANITVIQSILDASDNNYAVVVAAQSLLRLVTDHWNSFSEGQHVDIRNYILAFLANKGPRLQQFAITAVVQLLCRITKYAWMDEGTSIRAIVTETKKFLQATVTHCSIGLRILNELVTEMNVRNRNRSLTQHRRAAVSFRDQSLLATFEISLSMLNQIATRSISLDGMAPADAARAEDTLLEQSLSLLCGCLSFDFIGTNPDESTEEAGTLQVPTTWRDRIQNGASLRLLFNVYKGATTGRIPLIPDAPAPPVSAAPVQGASAVTADALRAGGGRGADAALGGAGSAGPMGPVRDFPVSAARARQALEALCFLVSVRRSLFNTELERRRFLGHIIRGVCDILREEQGFRDADCYHQFARLLSKIKNNFQLAELVRTEGYAEWVEAVAAFTIASCGKPVWASNSMHYILGLWSRLVASVPYVRMEANSYTGVAGGGAGGTLGAPPPIQVSDVLIDAYIPKIIGAYLRGRVESLVGPQAEEALEELNDIECIEDQLEQLPGICRYQYEAVAGVIFSIMDPLLQRYNEGITYLRTSGQAGGGMGNGGQQDSVLAALRITECQLAWVVAVVGAIVSGAGQSSSITAYYSAVPGAPVGSPGAPALAAPLGEEAWDADLSRRVLSLISQVDMRISAAAAGSPPSTAAASALVRFARVDPRLELAFIYFMSAFRRAYISEQSGMPPPASGEAGAGGSVLVRTASGGLSPISTSASALLLASSTANVGMLGNASGAGGPPGAAAAPPSLQEQYASATGRQKVFLSLFIRMSLGDHLTVVTMMLQKIANNLRFWVEREDIIRRTLEVFHDLVFSYSSGRLLLSLDTVNHLLLHHTQEHLPFLAVPSNSRFRTTFYTALARLVFMEDDSEKFEPFFAPLLATLDKLGPAVAAPLRTEEVMRTLVGLCRDLRGVLAAAHNRAAYTQVFEALFPNHIRTISLAADVWADTPSVSNVLLKLMAELVFNRAQRIAFGTNSPNGILLFREASLTICNYGRKIHGFTPPFGSDSYPVKYKGITEVMRIVNRCLDGGFVNFGVFTLYGDRALDSAFDTVFQLALGIQPAELASFTKLSQQFMIFLHVVCRSHMEALTSLPQSAFLQVMSALKDGIDSLDADVSTHAASALDHLSAFYVRHLKRETPSAAALRRHVSASPGIFDALMRALFQIVVFGEAANQWALARPLLGLLLAAESIRPDAFESFKADLLRSQPSELQPRMSEELNRLSRDVVKSLDILNRDRFTQKLTVFRLAVKDFAAS